MFPPIQCSKSSYFTQWLISEYLNRINNDNNKDLNTPPQQQLSSAAAAPPPPPPPSKTTTSSSSHSSSSSSSSSSSTSITSGFSAKNLKHLFTHHHHHHHHHNNHTSNHHNNHHSHHHHSNHKESKVKSNNNEYKNNNGALETPHPPPLTKNIEFIQLLALNALEFTAPIYSFNRKQQQQQLQQQQQTPLQQQQQTQEEESKQQACRCPSTRTFVQLSGHPGSFAPAGPNTVWKKMPEDQWGASCGRQQVGSGIGMDGSLRELLQALNNNCAAAAGGGHDDQERQQANAKSLSNFTSKPLLPPSSSESTTTSLSTATTTQTTIVSSSSLNTTTTPITVFFNSNNANNNTATSSSSSSSSTSKTAATPSPASSSSSSSSPASSSSSSSNLLLPPQIYQIPTHLLPNETQVYRRVNATTDPIQAIIPKYVTETCYNSQMFLELEDLLTNFSQSNPTIMDIKLGTRTFLESEVKNSKPRPDLYQKLIAVDPTACTAQEHEQQAVTKLTYMLFREKQSSSTSLGFRVEGVKMGYKGVYQPDLQLKANFKVLKDEGEISSIFKQFCKGESSLIKEFCKRLEFIRDTLERSEFFMTHEVIGSSLLFIHDDEHVGVWLIDFAKTFLVGQQARLSHRDKWVMGNREDGVLTGVDNIIRLFQGLLLGR